MYNYKISKIVPNDWNENLKKSAHANFFQTSDYLETTSINDNGFPLFISVHDDSQEVVGQLGLVIRESVRAHSSTAFNSFLNNFSNLGNRGSWAGGPIIHGAGQDRIEILKAIIKSLNEIGKEHRLAVLDGYSSPFDFDINPDNLNIFSKNNFGIENFFTYATDLNQSLDDIWNNVHNSSRRDVKRAEKRGIIVKVLDSYEELDDYFSLIKTWAKTKGIISRDFSENYKRKFWNCIERNIEKIFLSYDNKEIVAGHRLGCFNNIAYSHKITNSYSSPTSLGGPILTWYAIKWAKENGMHTYDFSGGASPPDDKNKLESYHEKWDSLLYYKKKWGGKTFPYFHFVKVFNKKKYGLFRVLYKPDYLLREYKRKHHKRPR